MSAPNPPVIMGLGELLWDVFPDSRRPGGAPSNVAFQASQLGLTGLVASRVGRDPLGDELLEFLRSKGLDTSLIQIDDVHPTGQVTVDLADEGHPDYVIHEQVAWDFLEPAPALLDAASRAAAVCFGTLAQRGAVSREAIHTVLAACPDECLIVYDVNLRQQWYQRDWVERSLRQARVVKLNREEVALIAPLLDLGGDDPQQFAAELRDRYDVGLTCITRAEAGCLLITADETVDVAGHAVTVVDAVGAGDAFTAALIASQLWGWPLSASARFANAAGALVTTRSGAMPPLTKELSALRDQYAP